MVSIYDFHKRYDDVLSDIGYTSDKCMQKYASSILTLKLGKAFL